jgi:hypothetical protein
LEILSLEFEYDKNHGSKHQTLRVRWNSGLIFAFYVIWASAQPNKSPSGNPPQVIRGNKLAMRAVAQQALVILGEI